MSDRISLREYQRELAERLRNAAGGATATKLGVQVDDESWLVDLGDVGEVIPVPAIAPVPLTHPWFKGVVNIRGNLHCVIDFAAFLGRRRVKLSAHSRLVVIGERFRLGAALLVDRSLGLRNPTQLRKLDPAAAEPGSKAGYAWSKAEYDEPEGRRWKELDLPQLAQHPDFLAVGV